MYIPTTFIIWLRGPNSLAIIMTARSRHAFRLSLSQTPDSHLPPFFFGLAGHFRTWHVEDQSAASVANLAIEDRLSTFSSIFAKYR